MVTAVGEIDPNANAEEAGIVCLLNEKERRTDNEERAYHQRLLQTDLLGRGFSDHL